MYEYDDEEGGGGRSKARTAGMAVGALALALVGWFVVKPRLGGDGQDGSVAPASVEVVSTPAGDGPQVSDPSVAGDTSVDTMVAASDREAVARTTGSAATRVATTATTATPGTAGSTTPPATAATTTAPPVAGTYDTLPDGSPVPVVALFGPSTITLSGAVPDQAAKDRLQTLALANAKPGQGTVENLVVLNPAVPRSVGVRVVELTSVRFPEGSAEILPDHALELDRAVGILNALSNVTVLVIGHGDQGGDGLVSYALSKERANAVVNHFARAGISPMRLSARAVGDADLLTLNDDAAALELNRRTEFVFNGLLVGS